MKIEDYLHLYLGCEVEWGFDGRKKIGELVGKDERYGWQIFDPSNAIVPYQPCKTELIKPILRPLSDITKDEAIILDKAVYGIVDDDPYALTEFNEVLLPPYPVNARPAFPIYAKIINQLRKMQFDCDGLIEAGLALDKTKL